MSTQPSNAQQRTGSPERRAQVVAGIRALADLIETNLNLPVPQSISAQHSLSGLTAEGVALIQATAAALGVTAEIEDSRATAQYAIVEDWTDQDGPLWVRYAVHGQNQQADGGEQA